MLSIFAEFVQACSKQRLSILNTNLENIQYHTSALPVASHSSLIEHNKQHSIKETCPFEKCGKTFIRFMLINVKGTKEHFLVITSTFVFDSLTLFKNTFVYYGNIHFYNFLFAFVSMEML